MKVSVGDFKTALALFESEFIGTMKTTLQKFIVGATLAAGGKKIDEMIAPFVQADGTIDTDVVKAIIDAGLKQSGGEVEIPLSFGVFGTIGANPIVTRITKMDVDKFFTQTLPAVAKPMVTPTISADL